MARRFGDDGNESYGQARMSWGAPQFPHMGMDDPGLIRMSTTGRKVLGDGPGSGVGDP